LIVETIMRCRAMTGQGGTVCDLGRLERGSGLIAIPGDDHFPVSTPVKINDSERMATMNGI
jgi:hypothetical protein